MLELKNLIEQTIGKESFYILEKSRSAIHSANSSNVDFVKSLLETYKSKYDELHVKIKSLDFYDAMIYEEDFQTLTMACKKLVGMLGNISNDEDELIAKIYQKHIAIKDKEIRQNLKEDFNK